MGLLPSHNPFILIQALLIWSWFILLLTCMLTCPYFFPNSSRHLINLASPPPPWIFRLLYISMIYTWTSWSGEICCTNGIFWKQLNYMISIGLAKHIQFYFLKLQSTKPQFVFFLWQGGENCWEGSTGLCDDNIYKIRSDFY